MNPNHAVLQSISWFASEKGLSERPLNRHRISIVLGGGRKGKESGQMGCDEGGVFGLLFLFVFFLSFFFVFLLFFFSSKIVGIV